jgi:TonB family protein
VLSAAAVPIATWLLPFRTTRAGPAAPAAAGVVTRAYHAVATPAMQLTASLAGPVRTVDTNMLWIVWTAGASLALLMLAAGVARLAWAMRHARPLCESRWLRLTQELASAMGIRRPVRLLLGRPASMPLTWGFIRPCLLLPEEAEQWGEARMRIVLSHELAHVRRNDWLVQMFAETGRAFYWFHPLMWLGCNRLRRESEQACDDAVLNTGIGGPEYAEQILSLACALPAADRPWSVALAMARVSNLERRFAAMLDPSRNRCEPGRRAAWIATAAALLLLVPIAALRAPAQASGRFTGTVLDASGAVVPNATVVMSNQRNRTRDMTTTGAAGDFELSGLPAGEYTMEVMKPGFALVRLVSIALRENQDLRQDVTLRIGSVQETIDVVAEGTPRVKSAAAPGRAPERILVGGNVQRTRLVNLVRPVYPGVSKAAGIEGTVLLEAVISVEGDLLSLRVMNSQVDPDLARAAVEAVSQWKYAPTLLNGKPVEVTTTIQVNFKLSQ